MKSNLNPHKDMDIRKQLHELLLAAGFKHNTGDDTYSQHLSGTFSLEVGSDLTLHIVCCADASETGVEHAQLGFDNISLMLVVERTLCDILAKMNEERLSANLNAAMKMLERIP